jgi:thioredoxin-like negative regulator of GroEL
MRKLLIFSASWCQPCKQMKDDLVHPLSLNVDQITTIDVDQWKELCIEHSVRSVPTLILIENDLEVRRKTGRQSRAQLQAFCE